MDRPLLTIDRPLRAYTPRRICDMPTLGLSARRGYGTRRIYDMATLALAGRCGHGTQLQPNPWSDIEQPWPYWADVAMAPAGNSQR